MNPLLELFPESVWIDGKEYAIRSGFRTVLKINNIVGEEKKRLTVQDLLVKFEEAGGEDALSDRMILA